MLIYYIYNNHSLKPLEQQQQQRENSVEEKKNLFNFKNMIDLINPCAVYLLFIEKTCSKGIIIFYMTEIESTQVFFPI